MRVFVSSVMQGFDEERRIAKETIEALGMTPVMAENFGALAQSPESACIEGVRNSDCYLGIFAERYGFQGPSGEAVTVEEFREADRHNLPILLIVKELQDDKREPRLAFFLREVGEYQRGYFQGRYATLTQLAIAITKALRQQHARGVHHCTETPILSDHINQILKSKARHSTSPILVVAVMPADERGSIDARKFSKADFRQRVSRIGRYESGVFSESMGIEIIDGPENLDVVQTTGRGDVMNLVRIGTDGSIVVLRTISQSDDHVAWGMGSLTHMIIDESQVLRALTESLVFSDHLYHDPELGSPPPRVFVQAGLSKCEGKRFGMIGDVAPTRMSYPGREVEDPVIVPNKPMSTVLSKEESLKDLSDRLRDAFARAFKAVDAYYDPNGSERR